MKKFALGLTVLALGLAVGCNSTNSGSGAAAGSYKITGLPATSVSLKQGESQKVKMTVSKTKEFKEDVTVKFEAPTGITVEPSSVTVKAADGGDLEVTVSAAKDAPVGEGTVKVTGTAKGGSPVMGEFKVKVDK